jgi:hypothetical protein
MSVPDGWLSLQRPPVTLRCVYCGTTDAFSHAASYVAEGELWHLHRCPSCGSLTYDMVTPTAHPADRYTEREHETSARYYLEVGYFVDFIVLCALSALGDLPEEQVRNHIFFDVGAGMGVSSYFVREMFDAKVVAIEPSITGRFGRKIFGVDIRSEYLEDLSPEAMQRLRGKPCLVHLDAVVEHLVDPRTVLSGLITELDVQTMAIVVPDAAVATPTVPFLHAYGTLLPGDHLHLPTQAGVMQLLEYLGFAYHAVQSTGSLIIAVGGRRPVSIPSAETVAEWRDKFLQRLIDHPDPHVALGAAARLLPYAVSLQQLEVLERLRKRFAAELKPDELLDRLAHDADFERIPFHLAPTCFWLAVAAISKSDIDLALLTSRELRRRSYCT